MLPTSLSDLCYCVLLHCLSCHCCADTNAAAVYCCYSAPPYSCLSEELVCMPAAAWGRRYMNHVGTLTRQCGISWPMRCELLVFICIDEVPVGVTVVWLCWSKCVWSSICTVMYTQDVWEEYSSTLIISPCWFYHNQYYGVTNMSRVRKCTHFKIKLCYFFN